jgi:hypothetical protein
MNALVRLRALVASALLAFSMRLGTHDKPSHSDKDAR